MLWCFWLLNGFFVVQFSAAVLFFCLCRSLVICISFVILVDFKFRFRFWLCQSMNRLEALVFIVLSSVI
eukprot:34488_1